MAIDSMQKANNFRWGDMDEDGDLDFLLPPKQVIGPDRNGIKKVIEYKFNDEGKKVKVTTTIRVQKRALNKQAAERRSWIKFGDAAHEDAAGSYLTVRSTEDIHLERIRAPGSNVEEAKSSESGKAGGFVMVCRLCHMKGDHWTSKCPKKDLLSLTNTSLTTEADTGTGTGKASYVPPNKRGGADRNASGSDMRRRNDENSIRVSNLSEDAREPDLMELFSPFGAVSRVYVPIDRNTGMSRGSGYVNFVSKEDAERAINKLNGYGYDNLILTVEWSPPRPT